VLAEHSNSHWEGKVWRYLFDFGSKLLERWSSFQGLRREGGVSEKSGHRGGVYSTEVTAGKSRRKGNPLVFNKEKWGGKRGIYRHSKRSKTGFFWEVLVGNQGARGEP